MIQCTVKHITFVHTGGTLIEVEKWLDFTHERALAAAGIKERSETDGVRTAATGDIIVERAMEKPWTWDVHVFVNLTS